MSIRGSVTLECDSKGCHAEEVLEGNGLCNFTKGRGIAFELFVNGWVLDDDGLLHCPQCVEEAENPRDDDYERAAARARNNDFADTGGKDWT